MLMLTEQAAETIRHLIEPPEASGLRISTTESNDGGGLALELEVATAPDEQDAVLEGGGASVFLTPPAAAALDDKVLHAEADQGQVQFTVLEQTEAGPGPGREPEADR